jgi:DNA-binding Lrp family transcriptional regulator
MTPQVAQVLEAISDDTSFNIIDIVINSSQSAESLIDKLNIPTKQCYDRIRELLAIGIIKRKGLNYTITSFGRMMYEAQLKVAKAAQRSSKLKMIDAVRSVDLPQSEYSRTVDEFIDDFEIKNLILNQGK